MAAAAIDIEERAKWDAYLAEVAKRPKQDRRDYAAAGEQTKWIMAAVTEWYEFSFVNYKAGRGPAGLPTENVLHRAGLMLPRAPMRPVELIKDPPAIVIAVGKAIEGLKDSRVRVLIACEASAKTGIESAAHRLGMSVASTKAYLREAREGLAIALRVMGWRVPKGE